MPGSPGAVGSRRKPSSTTRSRQDLQEPPGAVRSRQTPARRAAGSCRKPPGAVRSCPEPTRAAKSHQEKMKGTGGTKSGDPNTINKFGVPLVLVLYI